MCVFQVIGQYKWYTEQMQKRKFNASHFATSLHSLVLVVVLCVANLVNCLNDLVTLRRSPSRNSYLAPLSKVKLTSQKKSNFATSKVKKKIQFNH